VARDLRRHGVAHDEVRVARGRQARAEVRALSGQDRVPLAVLGGEAICDSRRIAEHLAGRRAASV
jgi:glutathione S-transferase